MRRSEKAMAIYRELRQGVGGGATAGEVLACAASLVDLFHDEDEGPIVDWHTGRQPFDMLPVDVAVADGGWRLLSREWHRLGWESSDDCGGKRPREWFLR